MIREQSVGAVSEELAAEVWQRYHWYRDVGAGVPDQDPEVMVAPSPMIAPAEPALSAIVGSEAFEGAEPTGAVAALKSVVTPAELVPMISSLSSFPKSAETGT